MELPLLVTQTSIACFSCVPLYSLCVGGGGMGWGEVVIANISLCTIFCTKDVARMYSNPISNCVDSALIIPKKQKTSTPHGSLLQLGIRKQIQLFAPTEAVNQNCSFVSREHRSLPPR